jgi:uncharacterized SAM-binding protein YcdF (DUF218 family)
MASSGHSSQKLLGILTRKERWGLSLRGWLLVATAGVVATYFGFLNIQPFLAVTHRVNTNVLVVEGWIPPYAIQASVEEFKTGSYQRVFTTGGPVEGNRGYVNDYYTSASVGEEQLKKRGIPSDAIQMVPSHVMARDRTYSSAVALREWFHEHNMIVQSVNVVTENVHARRTRLLFEEALGKDVVVGIISVPNPDYNPRYWWRYSDGVREVIGEGIAYIYARFFFHPSKSTEQEHSSQLSSQTSH